jgi:hypothetical protein
MESENRGRQKASGCATTPYGSETDVPDVMWINPDSVRVGSESMENAPARIEPRYCCFVRRKAITPCFGFKK